MHMPVHNGIGKQPNHCRKHEQNQVPGECWGSHTCRGAFLSGKNREKTNNMITPEQV
jgi:hypothetical protein